MINSYNKTHSEFRLNGTHYAQEDLAELAYTFIKEGRKFEQDIGEFLLDWIDDTDFIIVHTSGSTGQPKAIKIKKQAMVNSAIATGNFFNLKPGSTALHGLPTQFIAGKMMMVRALVLGLKLDCIAPKSVLNFNHKKNYAFCAMVPLQLENSLNHINNIQHLIIGGAPVSERLKSDVQNLKTNIYETYGMTETVTHIAVKKLNNTPFSGQKRGEPYFKTLPNISISQDERDCLVIDAVQLSETKIITNDVVKLHAKDAFEWLGRYDNIINSGGVKLAPEQIEAKLQGKIQGRFFIASETHSTLGEQLILVLENKSNDIDSAVFSELEKFEKPKKIYNVITFIETKSGKINRKETLKTINP